MNTIGHFIASIGLVIGSWFGYQPEQVVAPVAPVLGDFNPTGGGTYRLQSSIGGSTSSITLTSFKEPVSNIKYTMAYLNSSIEYATIEPQSSNKEFISFTGITQNGDGSATLTGVSRGLGFSYPYTASTTLQQSHSAQSILILSNPPQLYKQYPAKDSNETITGQWTFSTFPITPSSATSSYNVSGGAQLASPAEQALGTATSSNGNQAPLILASKNATSTFGFGTGANKVVVTNTIGHIDAGFVSSSTQFSTTATTTLTSTSTVYIGAFPAWHIGKQRQVFTSMGTSTFSVPSGITKVSVRVQGGGGGGRDGSTGGAGGSGAGGYAEEIVDVSGTTTIQVYVGNGGSPGAPATNGFWSTFGTNGFYLSASGGIPSGSSNGGIGGCGSGGDVNICGGGGMAGNTGTASIPSGAGGSSPLGGGGAGVMSGTGGDGKNYGGGAAGGGPSSGSGGTGAPGSVIVEW